VGNRPHYKLKAWQTARSLVGDIYRLTQGFPKHEVFGLTLQLRRAAISIPSNLAEGAGRNGNKEFAHFLSIAMGSLSELETQLLIASDLHYIDENHEVFAQVEEVSRLLAGLIKAVR
jgi:four helix bundle protein